MQNSIIPIAAPKLTFDQKESMLLHILRLPVLFTDARRQLKVEYFDKTYEVRYAILWKAALDVAERSRDKLPEKGAKRRLEIQIKSMLEVNPDIMSLEQQEDLLDKDSGFLSWAYSVPVEELYEKDGRDLLEMFLRERLIYEPLKRYMSDVGDYNPSNLPNMLKSIAEKELKLATVRVNPISNAFPEGWKPKPLKLVPVCIDFLDAFMKGQAGGEVYGLLGPTGVGKTLLGIKIVVEGAFYQQRTYVNNTKEMGHWYYVTYESPIDPDIRLRTVSYAAVVAQDVLFEGLELSTTNNLKQYELARWKTAIQTGQKILGEQERINAIIPKLQQNLWFMDLSGALVDSPGTGSNGVDEIADFLAGEQDSGKRIAGIVIDYVKIAVERQMAAEGVSTSELRHYVAGYGDRAKQKLAMRFNCPVWLLHQLTGEANMRSPTSKQHHAMAAEAKNFADNLWYCFNLGTKDQESSCCQLSCSKERRSFSNGLTPLLYIDGLVGDMRRADDLYTVEGNRIVSKEYKNKIVSNTPVPTSASRRPSPANDVGFTSR